ncbi:MAG: MFS transporter, partial [Saprospiraceae bacterium]|nr:MFS transporter [Saprospiraceae bacterium]
HRMWQTAGYYAAFIILGLTTSSFGPALPYLAEQTHSQLNQVSSLFAFRSFGYLLGSLRGGWLYDHRPGHPVFTAVLLLLAIGMALVPAIPLLIPMTIILFLVGLCEGTMDVGGNTLLIWAHGPKVGPFMNGLHFFFGIGAFLAPIFIAQSVLILGQYGPAYWLIALLMLPVALGFSRISSPKSQVSHASNTEKTFNRRLVVLLIIFFFLYVGAEVSFGGWIFTYATRLNLADEAIAAYITSAFWGALTAGRLLGIPISARLEPKTILWVDLIGCAVSVLVIVLFPVVQAVIWICSILLGLSMASIFPTALTFAEKRLNISGSITSWFFVGASLGGMILPWIIGQVFEPLGPPITMSLILGDILLAIVVFYFIK